MRELKRRLFLRTFLLALLLSQMGISPLAATATDWGYDDPVPNKKSPAAATSPETPYDDMKRQPAPKQPATTKTPGAKSKMAASFLQPDVIDVDHALRAKQAKNESLKQRQMEKQRMLASEWLELYSLVAVDPLTDEQKRRFEEKLVKAAGLGKADFEAIDKFWPLVKKTCLANTEQQSNYRDLFRALFRLEMRQQKENPIESELVAEIIGPERVAVPDNPPLTEDAVEAYADMTCFIYNQTHPGKSVDALDNRTVFVATLERRYMHCESSLEKLAMSNFALKWGKFKVLYADANDADKDKLFKRVSGTSPEPLRKDMINPALDAVMKNGPWVPALTSTNDFIPLSAGAAGSLSPQGVPSTTHPVKPAASPVRTKPKT